MKIPTSPSPDTADVSRPVVRPADPRRVRNPGKFGKAKRGGGRHFSRDLSRLGSDGEPEKGSESSSEESSSEEEVDDRAHVGQLPPIADSDSEEETHGLQANLNSTLSTLAIAAPEEAPASSNSRLGAAGAAQIAQARKDRKAAQGEKKASGAPKVKGSGSEESEDENDNRKAGKMMKAADLAVPREMSRREREQAEKNAAKERYAKMHAAGKTDEARADLGRLAEIRKKRELAAAQRVAETSAKEEASKVALEKSGKKVPLRR